MTSDRLVSQGSFQSQINELEIKQCLESEEYHRALKRLEDIPTGKTCAQVDTWRVTSIFDYQSWRYFQGHPLFGSPNSDFQNKMSHSRKRKYPIHDAFYTQHKLS